MTQLNAMGALVCLIVICTIYNAESLVCIGCQNSHNTSECHTTVQCSNDQHCYTDVTGVGSNAIYNLGCRNIQKCWAIATNTTASPISSIIGRRFLADVSSCTQCCSQDFCNHQLCSHYVDVITDTDGQCADNANYNCELISGAFNVCNNLHQAKTYCRKWCGLCSFTDGGWSDWTSWNSCDVTCSSGHHSRSRSCTHPKPSVGGLDCVGNSTEISQCTMDTCPVHGNWTLWTSWGTCSSSCGVGLQRRDRSCSHPVPGPNGQPCMGDSHEDIVCMVKACADGLWSSWSIWGACSNTCNGGLKVKQRTCDSPTPSPMGQYCEGNGIDFTTCNSQDCPRMMVYFTVTNPNGTLINGRPIFTRIVDNVGGGYNPETTLFTSPVSGLYQFTFTIVQESTSNSITFCYLEHNSFRITYTAVKDNNVNESSSESVYVHLKKNDTFALGECSNWNHVSKSYDTLLTGALLQQD